MAVPSSSLARVSSSRDQSGVVLVIALVLLVVMSLLAATSLHNVSSSESVASNVRTTELATQAAEIALRHCEDSVQQVIKSSCAKLITTTFTSANILPYSDPPKWSARASSTGALTNWDGSGSTSVFVLPLGLVNQIGMATATYQRAPECMVEPLPMRITDASGTGDLNEDSAFVITARGFGPEVATADADRQRPLGTEVWLQSHIELDPDTCATPPPPAVEPPPPVTDEEIEKDREDKEKKKEKENKDKEYKEDKKKKKHH